MKHARSSGEKGSARYEGSIPSPSAAGKAEMINRLELNPVGGLDNKTAAIVDCSHLWVIDGQLVIRGMVVTGKECTELPWRRKKDGEPASQAEIAREIELVKALWIRSKVQMPGDFADTKLFIREDVK